MISSELRRYVSNPMYQLPGSRNGKFGRHSLELPGLSIDPGVVLHSRHLLLYASHFCAMFELIPVEYEHLAAVDLPRPRPRSGAEVVLALIRPATNTRGVPGALRSSRPAPVGATPAGGFVTRGSFVGRIPRLPGAFLNISADHAPYDLRGGQVFLRAKLLELRFLARIYQDRQPGRALFEVHYRGGFHSHQDRIRG